VFDGVFNGNHTEVDGKHSADAGVTPKVALSAATTLRPRTAGVGVSTVF